MCANAFCLLIYILCASHCLWGSCVCLSLSLFWYALLCVLSSFAIILKRKRELVALLLLSNGCLVTINDVALTHGAVGWSVLCDCGIS